MKRPGSTIADQSLPRRVVLDACVLYPPSLRDLLLTLAALDAFEVVWTERILEEVERNVLADNADIDPERFRRHTLGAMRAAFPDATAEPLAEDELAVTAIDLDDRHVVAAAVAAGADAIVTINVRHFPASALNPAGLAVLTPGLLLDMLETSQPSLVDQALDAMSRRWKNPPRTSGEIMDLLMVHPTMAEPVARIARRRD